MAEVVVLLLKVPQAVPEHDVPDMLHVTPLLLLSLVTVAVRFTVCPESMVVWAEGERETEIAGGGTDWFPPQLQIRNMADSIKASFLIIWRTPILRFQPDCANQRRNDSTFFRAWKSGSAIFEIV